MNRSPELYWLPGEPDWRSALRGIAGGPVDQVWEKAVALANTRLNFVQTNGLDEVVRHRLGTQAPANGAVKAERLAILGSSTFAHLHAPIRVAGLRRAIPISVYENDYGQYDQELANPGSGLYAFAPTAILFAFDANHITGGITASLTGTEADAALDAACERIAACWRRARDAFHCPILQQAVLPVWPAVLGGNEHVLPGSRSHFIARVNERLRERAAAESVDILSLDRRAAQDGLWQWHDAALWHRTKQEVVLTAAPMYGDLVGRWVAAKQGRSAKCLILDLDNTIWGGVVGDDGVEGLELGQGSPLGEAFVAVQDYARELARRGVILAVCSKNDEANAFEPFDRHPEMVLRRGDIASFVANWSDKATNIRAIAEELNIGLNSLVFVDDNPFEREQVRRELPIVAVPEVPEDPSFVPLCLADAGYFETIAVTNEDRVRTRQYSSNRERNALRTSSGNIESYLQSLEMELCWRRFDEMGLVRIVQLINKTNQFNLTTRRYTEDDVRAVIADPRAFGMQLRLLDRFGDNGIISIIIGRLGDGGALDLDTWLMSCRVLGRQVEEATLALIVEEARRLGASRLIGEYRPTNKNGMVRDHYAKLGFALLERQDDGITYSALDVESFVEPEVLMQIRQDVVEGQPA